MGYFNKQKRTWIVVGIGIAIGVGCLTNPSIAKTNNLTSNSTQSTFKHDKQVKKISPSGNYTIVIDEDSRAIVEPIQDGVYLVDNKGKISIDYMEECRGKIEAVLGKFYSVQEIKYEWKTVKGKEVFVITFRADQRGVYEAYHKQLDAVITIDPTNAKSADSVITPKEIVGKFKLTPEEKELYDAYIKTGKTEVLKKATPTQIFRLTGQCLLDSNKEANIGLILSNLDEKTLNRQLMSYKGFPRLKEIVDGRYGLTDSAKEKIIDDTHATINYSWFIADKVVEWEVKMVKQDGVWKVDYRF